MQRCREHGHQQAGRNQPLTTTIVGLSQAATHSFSSSPVLPLPLYPHLQAKYVGRAFVSPPPPSALSGPGGLPQQLGLLLYDAVDAGDVPGALEALAWGADPGLPVRGPRPAMLVSEMLTAASSPIPHTHGLQLQLPPLHAAAANGDVAMCELLLQSGAPLDAVDCVGVGHTALHYALLSDQLAAAKLLVRRGASLGVKDAQGRNAWDLVVSVKGRVADEELFLMLSGAAGGAGGMGGGEGASGGAGGGGGHVPLSSG